MSQGWINSALAALPGTNDSLFRNLWTERRLLFEGKHGVADIVDECSARLVVAALRVREPLFVVLPDFQPHRPAFLFATGLIRHWYDSRTPSATHEVRAGPILYFGSAVGIRDQLRRTTVSNLYMSLSEVFDQRDVSRGATGGRMAGPPHDKKTPILPSVVTVYSPADPVGVIRAYKPSWIAADCGDVPSLCWLRSLLEEAARLDIPLIAWGQNPLSECVNEFDNYQRAFIWPPSVRCESSDSGIPNEDAEALLNFVNPTSLLPIVIVGGGVSSFSNSLREASQILGHVKETLTGQFAKDAAAVHWRYLRSLESLSVPINFYETEAPRLWGLKSFGYLNSVCDHFRKACEAMDFHLYGELERIGSLLDETKGNLENHGCALWDALSNFCVEEPPSDEARIMLFTSLARKRLFLFSLLARHNFAEEDLRELRTYVASLNEYQHWMYYRDSPPDTVLADGLLMPPRNLAWHPIIVGLPSPSSTPRLLAAFLQQKVDILLYPHQCPLFSRRQAEWSDRLSANSKRIMGNIARLGRLQEPEMLRYPARVAQAEAIEMNAESGVKTKTLHKGPLWIPDDVVSEVARLFQTEDESAEEGIILADHAEGITPFQITESEEIWCQEAISVQFENGWYAYFSPDDVINVIIDGLLDPRFVRSLAGGERVLLINGQARQSLYDLIISRVHRHPSIELHLAMIRRWQEDFRMAFHQWRSQLPDVTDYREHGARDLNGLLRRMQALGSQLVCAATLSFWLNGLVLCPLDSENLRRLADVLKMSFVRQYYERIALAANRLRALHRSLSVNLNRWLEDHATGAANKSDNDVIDTELELTFGDVRNSLLVLRVIRIQKVIGPFLRSNLGRAQKDTGS